MRRLTIALALLAVALATGADGGTAAAPARVVNGFFASWDIYGRGYYVKDIPAAGVTHLSYAFAKPTAAGTCGVGDEWADYEQVHWDGSTTVDGNADAYPAQTLYGNFNELRKLKAAHPDLKILMSIGGWTFSTYFSDVAAAGASRAQFAASCIDMFIKGNLPRAVWPENAGGPGTAAGIFDGIDIDWEYPGTDPGNGAHYTAADRHNATLLLQELRRQLDALGAATGRHYLLTAALPAGNVNSVGSFELAPVARTLDWINLLTYDFHGPWDTTTNFNSPFAVDAADPTPAAYRPFFNVAGTVDLYRANGVPAEKLVVGVPFYARQYAHVASVNRGLYQPFDNTGLDPNTLQWDATPTPTYHDLVDVARIVTPTASYGNDGRGLRGFVRSWNEGAGEPWLYSSSAQRFISYDDPHSVAERVHYIHSRGLRGAMFWEISQDDDAHDLVNALAALR